MLYLVPGLILSTATPSRADPSFTYAPISTYTVFNPVSLDSNEWVRDQNFTESDQPPRQQYAPNLNQHVRILSNPYGRELWVIYSDAFVKEGDPADAIELGWQGALLPSSIISGVTAPRPIAASVLGSSGSNSLMSPGALHRFRSGPAPGWANPGDSEDYGFTVSWMAVFGGAFGSASAHFLPPYERAVILLNANDDIVDLVLPPRASNQASTFAAWLNPPANPTANRTGVWARCNAYPDGSNWDRRAYFSSNVPIFLELGACSGSWFVTLGTTEPDPVVVHVTGAAHNLNRVISGQRIGVKFNATASERAGILYGFQSAAWRVYGASMGTSLLKDFRFYNNSNCGKLFGCGGGGCGVCVTTENGTSNVSSFDGYMTLYNDVTDVLRTNNRTMIDGTTFSGGPAEIIAHEAGHKWLGLPDEYQVEGSCPNVGVGLCGHSLMEVMWRNNQRGLCTDANHRGHVDDMYFLPTNRVDGPDGWDCVDNRRWADAQSSWSRWSSNTPGNAVPASGAQNLLYVPQMFTSVSSSVTTIGRGAFY